VTVPANVAYVGTYTRGGRAHGIHVFGRDPASGALTERSKIAEVDPSYLAFDPSRRFLFAVSEGATEADGAVASFGIDPKSGELGWLSRQLTGGGEPCHLCVDPTGQFLIVANHENGSVAVFPIDAEGRLVGRSHRQQHVGAGPGPTQLGPHAHHVTFDPLGQRVLVTEKGIDRIMLYRLDLSRGTLVPNDPPFGRVHPGAAPRHLAFGKNGRYAYVNGEADMTLAAFSYDASSGAMDELQVVPTVPAGSDTSGWTTAEVVVEPGGRYVYVSNRGHDSVAIFAIDTMTGRLTPRGSVPTGGKTPRSIAIDPSGRRLYAANQDSDTIVHFALDPDSGALTPTGQVTPVGAPVCILFS
jgi:6-phosphogluconolactonase